MYDQVVESCDCVDEETECNDARVQGGGADTAGVEWQLVQCSLTPISPVPVPWPLPSRCPTQLQMPGRRPCLTIGFEILVDQGISRI